MTKIKEPRKKWRIVRGGRGNYRDHDFTTKEERDEAGHRWAAIDHDPVLLESWSAGHPQDELNEGWACDGVAYPPGEEPPTDPRPRTTASKLEAGQVVSVWGFPTADRDDLDRPAAFVDGTVEEVGHSGEPLPVVVRMSSGRLVFCVPSAIAYLGERVS